jgi:iron complex outermembrane receptor protein
MMGALAVGSSLPAQTGTITGTVTSAEEGRPIPGAQMRAGNAGAITNEEGRYSIQVAPGTYTVFVRRIGFAPDSTLNVMVQERQSVTVNFTIRPSAAQLEGVVVVGYGTQEARDRTGVVTTVSEEEFNTGRIISAEQLIQAKVAGVQVVDNGEPGGGMALRIRGGTSVNASNEPLYVIDGIPLQIGGGISAGRNPLNFLNPADIDTITVLKDASATANYGSRGSNGVVLIT